MVLVLDNVCVCAVVCGLMQDFGVRIIHTFVSIIHSSHMYCIINFCRFRFCRLMCVCVCVFGLRAHVRGVVCPRRMCNFDVHGGPRAAAAFFFAAAFFLKAAFDQSDHSRNHWPGTGEPAQTAQGHGSGCWHNCTSPEAIRRGFQDREYVIPYQGSCVYRL